MSKKRNKPQPFGSRKGINTPVLRSGKVSMKNDNTAWFNDLGRLISEAGAMPSAAIIVSSYYRSYGHLIADAGALNESMQVLATVIQNHNEAVLQKRGELAQLKEEVGDSTKLTTSLTVKFLALAGDIQDIMNDFANVGMFAIDACLQHYRQLAETNENVPSPAYMCPQEGQPAMADLAPTNEVEMTIVGLPGELEKGAAAAEAELAHRTETLQ